MMKQPRLKYNVKNLTLKRNKKDDFEEEHSEGSDKGTESSDNDT